MEKKLEDNKMANKDAAPQNHVYHKSVLPPSVEMLNKAYRLLIDQNMDYAMFVMDTEGYILSWNRAAEQIKGYTPDEIIGKHFSIFYTHEDFLANHTEEELKIAKAKGHYEEEGWRVRKNGERFWAHVLITALYDEGKLIGFGKITQDLTQRKNEEEALKASEERLSLLIEATQDYAIFMLDKKGYITTWNSGAEHITGYSAQEIIGKHFSTFYTEDAKAKKHPDRELQIALEKGRYEEENWRIRKDGEQYWTNVIITPIFDKKGQHVGYGKVTRDLTESKRLDTLKRDFVSVVSHELRTPLTSIRGALSLLMGGAAGMYSEKAKSLISIANTNSDRLVRLINDILDIEKLEAGKMQFNFKVQDLGKIVSEAIAINEMYADKFGTILITHEVPIGLLVNVDSDRLVQVLTNLLSNAIKFSPENDHVIIKVYKQGDKGVISITNHGVGVPKEFQDKIFERFSQANTSSTRSEGGTGLGLAISKAIVERLAGTIDFKSVPGKETTFCIALPLVQEGAASVSETTNEDRAGVQRILICEDDEYQANYLSVMLQGAGYEVDITLTANQAKRMLSEKKYYALLLDLILPDMSGIELIKDIRRSKGGEMVPIIVISIMSKEGKTFFKGNALEVVDWIEKPVDFNRLAKAFELIKQSIKVKQPSVLHVEDDIDTQRMVSSLLSPECNIRSVGSLAEARSIMRTHNFHLIILDLVLPDGNGVELLPLLADKEIPVMVFASSELDPKYAHYVRQMLVKANTSPEKLVAIINDLLLAKS